MIDKDLLAEKIFLDAQWNSEYAKNGYTLDLLKIEHEIREIKNQMVSQEHDLAKREIKSPKEEFAVAS